MPPIITLATIATPTAALTPVTIVLMSLVMQFWLTCVCSDSLALGSLHGLPRAKAGDAAANKLAAIARHISTVFILLLNMAICPQVYSVLSIKAMLNCRLEIVGQK